MRQAILLLFYTSLDTALSSSALRQRTPHQACLYAPHPEVKPAVNTFLNLPSLAGTQCLSQDHLGKDEGSLGIPLLFEHPSPLRSQD